ncbi:MAG: gliding motility protein GldM [Sphingobacteriaceae bacterium]
MGGGKETPRQKMIGMMYLVLTALLAMNVSKQILKGYITVNESMEKSKANLTANNKRITEAFQNTINGNPAAKPYYDKAVEAQAKINEVVKYIDNLKKIVYEETEKIGNGDTVQLKYAQKIDDYDMPTHILIGSDAAAPENKPNSALELRSKMDNLMNGLITMLNTMQQDKKTKFLPEIYENLKKKFESMKPKDSGAEEDGIKMTWHVENFYHLPEAAVITNLNKMQADLKNLEAEILGEFSAASGKLAIKFDKLTAKVIAPSSYIQAGQPYKADIFLAASSSAMTDDMMQVLIGADSASGAGGTPVKIEGGMGKYEVGTGGQGEQTYKGIIKFKKPDGSFDKYPFQATYMVAAPSAAVALDKMNVFYIGVPNPISVSAGGVAPTDLQVSATGVKLTPKGAGKYEVTATSPGTITINVSAKTKDGTKPQGSFKFRVKKIPDPVTKVGGQSGNVDMKKIQLSQIGGVIADLPGFDFDAKFVVTSFELSAVVKGALKSVPCSGNQLSGEARSILAAAGVGSKIFFENVKAKGPDGSVRNIPGVTIKVK